MEGYTRAGQESPPEQQLIFDPVDVPKGGQNGQGKPRAK